MPEVNPENLRWARRSAALTVEQAARKIGLSGGSAVSRLVAIERGERQPSRANLRNMAKAYNRPILALYLENPPEQGERAPDLRTIRDESETTSAELDVIVRSLRTRQALLRDALVDEDEGDAIPQIASLPSDATAPALTSAIETATGFDLEEYRACRTAAESFGYVRKKVETLGIFVLLIGDLGHWTTKLDARVFRGIALPDSVVPLIIINDNDSKSAWPFTLFHELAHLIMGQSAISGYGGDAAAELICDEAAARVLLPLHDLAAFSLRGGAFDEQVAEIGFAANRWRVSRKMVAYNLMRANRISAELYSQFSARFDVDRIEFQAPSGSGGNYFTTRAHRLGRSFIHTVERMVSTGALTSRKAGIVLGVKPTSVGHLFEEAR